LPTSKRHVLPQRRQNPRNSPREPSVESVGLSVVHHPNIKLRVGAMNSGDSFHVVRQCQRQYSHYVTSNRTFVNRFFADLLWKLIQSSMASLFTHVDREAPACCNRSLIAMKYRTRPLGRNGDAVRCELTDLRIRANAVYRVRELCIPPVLERQRQTQSGEIRSETILFQSLKNDLFLSIFFKPHGNLPVCGCESDRSQGGETAPPSHVRMSQNKKMWQPSNERLHDQWLRGKRWTINFEARSWTPFITRSEAAAEIK
jgi:hypothetical protein